MRKIIAVLLLGMLAIASGCIGEKAGLTKEKVLTAIQNIETAHYNESFSMNMNVYDPNTNKTLNVMMSGNARGVFNKSAGIEVGNMSVTTRTMGMNISMNWPYFANGSNVYFKIDGKWYLVPSNNDLYDKAKGSLNVGYIEKLLQEKNVTFKKLGEEYAFRVNVTFWEFVNATNQSAYLNEMWGGPLSDNITVNTNTGWVEVHFRSDGTPTFIETYMNLTITFDISPQEPVTVREVIHDSTILSDINRPVNISTPEGIKSAGNFEEVFG